MEESSQFFKIPVALDAENNFVRPEQAIKGMSYFCPSCHSEIVLRKGAVRKAHFAHKSNSDCNQETVIHKTTKLIVQKAVEDWKAGIAPAPVLRRKCNGCGKKIVQPLPDIVDETMLEYRLKSGLVADVVLLSKKIPRAAIEIRVTHKVDEYKKKNIGIPFIELDGESVIDNPAIWEPVEDKFKPIVCTECREFYLQFIEKAKKVSKQTGVAIPEGKYYRYGITTCWKCKKEILVFDWPKGGIKDYMIWEKTPPKVKPIPKTIQYRFSKTAEEKYWVNTCPYCSSIQGYFFLHLEPDSPFFGISRTNFETDMLMIARKVIEQNLPPKV